MGEVGSTIQKNPLESSETLKGGVLVGSVGIRERGWQQKKAPPLYDPGQSFITLLCERLSVWLICRCTNKLRSRLLRHMTESIVGGVICPS